MRINLIDELDAEWDTLRDSAAMSEALARWRTADPALGFPTVAALVAAVERRDVDPRVTDRILAGLARHARDDAMAARLLLQLLLPGCKRLVHRYGRNRKQERAAFVVAEAWEHIRRYPLERRPERVAANILLDVRQRLLRWLRRQALEERVADLPDTALPPVPGGPEPTQEAVALLGSAVRRGEIDRSSARLIALTRIAGLSVAEIAQRRGVKEQTLRRWRLRAEARVRASVTA